jgi:hypothetical protein
MHQIGLYFGQHFGRIGVPTGNFVGLANSLYPAGVHIYRSHELNPFTGLSHRF